MQKFTPLILACLLPAALAGCATPARVSPVEVTRFLGQAPAELGRGTIALRASSPDQNGSLEFAVYEQAVSTQLTQLGYRIAAEGTALQVAELRFTRSQPQEAQRRSPVNVGVGGSTGSYGSGIGLGVGINLGGKPAPVVAHDLAVTIRLAATGAPLWEGRAQFSATTNSDFSSNTAAANRLAGALFANFPGNSGETVEVK